MIEIVGGIVVTLLLLITIYLLATSYSRISCAGDLPSESIGYVFKGIVTRVTDGDNFRVFHVPLLRTSTYTEGDPTVPVNLVGISAPTLEEKGIPAQPYSNESKEYLESLLLGQKVEVVVRGIDMYGRIVAEVFLKVGLFSRLNINEKMVEVGMAKVLERVDNVICSFKDKLFAAEKRAKNNRVGIWSESK